MQFIKQSFMGTELDILTGHPEHDILFIATQVARAAGLKNPSVSVCNFRASKACTMSLRLGDIATHTNYVGSLPASPNGSAFKATTHVMDEATTYQMLLRGHAPASEPFRKWVTEIVLPTIRKTGSFNVNDAQDETSQQFAGEFAALHAAGTEGHASGASV